MILEINAALFLDSDSGSSCWIFAGCLAVLTGYLKISKNTDVNFCFFKKIRT